MSSQIVRPRGSSANIFINYRREDSSGHAGRLFDALSGHFAGRLFMDVDTLEPGVDFVEAIEQAVGSCEVLIVIIGREWLTIKHPDGHRRLDDPADFVRLEVESALGRKIRVIPVLVQDELPRPALQSAFLDDEHSVLLATMGFWQGFDAPGRTCSLVVIDRLPFARPDDPLADARRAAATRNRQNAFAAVDLPAAAVLLAQGAGRLIRAASDEGVVAVLDRRLATASYRWTLVRSLPPMRRTKDPEEARRTLRSLVHADGG